MPLPYIDTRAAELLFRSKVIAFLKAEGLLSNERIEMLYGWNHGGFSAHNSVTVQPEDHDQVERLARYLLLCAAAHKPRGPHTSSIRQSASTE